MTCTCLLCAFSSPCSQQISCHHLYSPFRSFQCERIVCFDNLWHSTWRFIQEFTSFPFNIVKCIIILLSLSNVYCTIKKKAKVLIALFEFGLVC